jgi:monoterpene epsilon-lactone hydrolase
MQGSATDRTSPTDLTLSSATYGTRADADPFFTRPQVAELVERLGGRPPKPLRDVLAGR